MIVATAAVVAVTAVVPPAEHLVEEAELGGYGVGEGEEEEDEGVEA